MHLKGRSTGPFRGSLKFKQFASAPFSPHEKMRSEDKQFIEGHTMDSQEPVSQDSLARTLHTSPFLVEEAGFFQVAFVCLVVTVNDTDAYLLGLETQVCRRGEENFFKKNGHAS